MKSLLFDVGKFHCYKKFFLLIAFSIVKIDKANSSESYSITTTIIFNFVECSWFKIKLYLFTLAICF